MNVLPQNVQTEVPAHQEHVKPIPGGFEIDVMGAIQASLGN